MGEQQANRYTRRSCVVPASTPKHNDLSVRRNLAGPLRLSVHDYHVKDADPDGITIVLTHGTSFNKHFWELIINNMLEKQELRKICKRFIALDAANHGDSALLNKDVLPTKACWADDSRDVLEILKHFEVKEPALGIGHSFGGGALSHAAMLNPAAFLATVFVEPILFQMRAQTKGVAEMALKRRDVWESKAAVTTAFQKSAGLRDWDAMQLQVYIVSGSGTPESRRASSNLNFLSKDQGTFLDQNSKVRLKTPKEQEAATYLAAPHPEILNLLDQSRGRHHFVWGSESKVISPEQRESVAKMLRSPSASQAIPGAGHLIPMTHPHILSNILGDLILSVAVFRPKNKL